MSSDIALEVMRAEQLAADGSVEGAQNALSALARDNRQPLLYRVQAIEALSRLNRPHLADGLVLELSQEIESSPRSTPTWNRLAKTLARMGHRHRALSLFERIIIEDTRCNPAIRELVHLGEIELLKRLVLNRKVFIFSRFNIARALTALKHPQYEKNILVDCASSEYAKMRSLIIAHIESLHDVEALRSIAGNLGVPEETREEATLAVDRLLKANQA